MTDNNESKVIKKLVKKDFNKLGLTLLMQELVVNGVMLVAAIGIGIMQTIKNPNISEAELEQIFKQPGINGTMSIIAVMIAFIPILIYRRKKFFQHDIKITNEKFTLKTVIISFIILLSVSNVLGLFTSILECGLNAIGLSASSALDNLEDLNELTISMIIYSCIVGPIVEEFIYRGAVLRSLEKHGKWFAITISGILFGLMHGNFYQMFAATGIGIILGYLATEYSIKLTILLHILNNTLVQIMSEITSHLSESTGNIIDIIMIIISAIILVMAFVYNRDHIKEWLKNNRMEKRVMLRFFTSITIILVIAFDLFLVAMGISKV